MRLRVFQEEVKTAPCLALVIVEFGHSESSRPSAWAELGSLGATYCPFNTVVPWAALNTGCQGRLGPFYSAEFSSDPARGQFGALLEARFINEETEAGLNVHSQNSVRTSCSKTGSEITPLGTGSPIREENARWGGVDRPCFPVGSLNFVQKLQELE